MFNFNTYSSSFVYIGPAKSRWGVANYVSMYTYTRLLQPHFKPGGLFCSSGEFSVPFTSPRFLLFWKDSRFSAPRMSTHKFYAYASLAIQISDFVLFYTISNNPSINKYYIESTRRQKQKASYNKCAQ